MGRVNDTISTVNSSIRTILALAICLVLAVTSYLIYDRISAADRELADAREQFAATQDKLVAAEETIVDLRSDLVEKQRQVDRLEAAMKLLKMDQRLAQLTVVEQQVDEQTERLLTTLEFTELSPEGNPIGPPKRFEIEGDVVYLDNWVVKFDDAYVEQADLQRGTSLALFRRIFGEFQSPSEGFLIDEVGAMPQAYARGGEPTEFEQEIWDDFWTFANDQVLASEKGIRAAHGEALSMKVEKGRSYRVELRASDGLSIVPEPASPAKQSD